MDEEGLLRNAIEEIKMKSAGGAGIRTHVVKGKSMRDRLRRRIRAYEARYEVSSERMARMIEYGDAKETAEIIKWMQAYRALQYLKDATPTTGTRGTTTRQSMNSG